MVLLGLVLEKDKVVLDFFEKVKSKIGVKDLTKNPYTDWTFREEVSSDSYFVALKFDHLYPDFSGFLLLPSLALLILLFLNIVSLKIWMSVTLIVSGLFLIVKYVRSKYFNFLIIRFNLARLGYKGLCKLLSTKQLSQVFPDIVLGELNGAG